MIIRSFVVFFLSVTASFAAQITLTTDPDTAGCNLDAAVFSVLEGANREGCIAIGAYGTDDTILVPASIPQSYTAPADSFGNPGNAVPAIDKTLVVKGIGGRAIISRSVGSTDNFRFFEIDKTGGTPLVRFENLRFEGGFSGGQGGAIYSDDADIEIVNCEFVQNQTSNASNGGAVYVRLGSLSITGSKFEQNAVNFDVGSLTPAGGALSVFATDVNIEETLFIGNSGNNDDSLFNVGLAGAIQAEGTIGTPSSVTIARSVFQDNLASGVGSGIGAAIMLSGNTALNVFDSTFVGNSAGTSAAGNGGAIAVFTSTGNDILLVNTTISGNTGRRGGGIDIKSSSVSDNDENTPNNSLLIINSIISGNEGSVASEFSFTDWQAADSLVVVNSLIGDDSENRADSIRIHNSDTSGVNNALESGSTQLLMSDEDNIALDAFLQPLEASGTVKAHLPVIPMGLAHDSGIELFTVFVGGVSKTVYPGCRGTGLETIATGDPDPAYRNDQLGTSRPKGAQCDIGSIELDPDADQFCWTLVTSNNKVIAPCL